jgi:hypothetical protein
LDRSHVRLVGRRRSQSARLCQHLDEDDRRHDRLPGEVPLEEEVGILRRSPGDDALAGHELDYLVNKAHRRTMWELIDERHRIPCSILSSQ